MTWNAENGFSLNFTCKKTWLVYIQLPCSLKYTNLKLKLHYLGRKQSIIGLQKIPILKI